METSRQLATTGRADEKLIASENEEMETSRQLATTGRADEKLVFASIRQEEKRTEDWFVLDPRHYSAAPPPDSGEKRKYLYQKLRAWIGPMADTMEEFSGFRERGEPFREAEFPQMNSIGKLEPAVDMEVPAWLDLDKILFYSFAACGSKIYFIGGMYSTEHDGIYVPDPPPAVYSPKVFTFDLTSKKWEEDRHQLRVARAFPKVVAIGKVIYVFGGVNKTGISKEEWIEYYNLEAEGDELKWQFLQNAPPDYRGIFCYALHQPRCQIIFWLYDMGGNTHLPKPYSFNYVTKGWTFLDSCTYFPVVEGATVVLEDVMFWHHYGTIHSYDLCNHRVLPPYYIRDHTTTYRFRDVPALIPDDESQLVAVGKGILLLLVWDNFSWGIENLHCYRFRFQSGSAVPLLLEAFGPFHTPGDGIRDVVVA